MKIKLIAPFKTNFNILYFNAMRDYKSYLEFWDTVQESLKNERHIEIFHTSNEELIYENIDTDGNNFSPEVLAIKEDSVWKEIMSEVSKDLETDCHPYQITFDDTLEETVCHIY